MAITIRSSTDNQPPRPTKIRLIKNVIVVCIGVILLFIAYDCLAMLQSTMNHEKGLGVWSQAIIYFSCCVSSLLLPPYVIKKIGSKTTFAMSALLYVPYIASNFYPHWSLMIATSVILGVSGPLMWGAQTTYLNDLSHLYAELTLESYNASDSSARCDANKEVQNVLHGSSKENTRSLTKNNETLDATPPQKIQNELKECCSGLISDVIKEDGQVKEGNDNFGFKCTQDKQDTLENNLNYDTYKLYDWENTKVLEGKLIITNHPQKLFFDKDSTGNLDKELQVKAEVITPMDTMRYSDVRKNVIESTTARVFGAHGLAFLSTPLWSNMMSFFVLKNKPMDLIQILSNKSCLCGAQFCNVEIGCFDQSIVQPDDSVRLLLNTLCVGVGLLAVGFIFLFLDPMSKKEEEVSFTLKRLMSTCRITKQKKCLLLIPLSFYLGMAKGFYVADFNQSYIACAWSTYNVGLVAMCFGASSGVTSIVSGWLIQRLGRPVIFSAAALVSVVSNILLLVWQPDGYRTEVFFLVAGFWGFFMGIFWPQLRGFFGILFQEEEEAAFSSFFVWYSLGFGLSFAYSSYLCTYLKIYLMMAVSVFGFAGYFAVERLYSKEKAQE